MAHIQTFLFGSGLNATNLQETLSGVKSFPPNMSQNNGEGTPCKEKFIQLLNTNYTFW